jgi:hypothetical protein
MNIPKHFHPPDKGEVGGSSPPRPTIQITSEYGAILTFPLFGDLPPKTDLSTSKAQTLGPHPSITVVLMGFHNWNGLPREPGHVGGLPRRAATQASFGRTLLDSKQEKRPKARVPSHTETNYWNWFFQFGSIHGYNSHEKGMIKCAL